MNTKFLLRLVFDFVAAGLLLLALAYWWLGNTVHEIAGTGFFLLLIVHNVFNRRWYGVLLKGRPEPRRAVIMVINFALLGAMVALLVTSIMISRTLLSVVGWPANLGAREIHILAAYWALIIMAVHLGLKWSVVMNAVRVWLRLSPDNKVRTWVLRGVATIISLYGLQSLTVMPIGAKLVMLPTMDMWDFNASTPAYFVHYGSIVGFFVCLSHYVFQWLQRPRQTTARP